MHSSCGGATGLRSAAISGGGGSSLSAGFVFSPSTPDPGQQVSFDASASTGNPTQYSWTFDDGTGGAGRTISHSYAAAGSYNLVLTVTAPSTAPSCPTGTSFARTTKTAPM